MTIFDSFSRMDSFQGVGGVTRQSTGEHLRGIEKVFSSGLSSEEDGSSHEA